MNREILFRGKLLRTGEWIEGYYCKTSDTTYAFSEDYDRYPVPEHHCILVDEMTDWGLPNRPTLHEVDPVTIGQYTGLTDRNGKRIFEGDILRYDDGETSIYDARWDYHRWLVQMHRDYPTMPDDLDDFFCQYAEVIGNIYDNPELLEVTPDA